MLSMVVHASDVAGDKGKIWLWYDPEQRLVWGN